MSDFGGVMNKMPRMKRIIVPFIQHRPPARPIGNQPNRSEAIPKRSRAVKK
jgi:hypothetical protein